MWHSLYLVRGLHLLRIVLVNGLVSLFAASFNDAVSTAEDCLTVADGSALGGKNDWIDGFWRDMASQCERLWLFEDEQWALVGVTAAASVPLARAGTSFTSSMNHVC